MDAERIMAYEVDGNRVSIMLVDGEQYYVVNTNLGKALCCLSLEHAIEMFDRCVSQVKGEQYAATC